MLLCYGLDVQLWILINEREREREREREELQSTPKCRLNIYKKSFVPDAIFRWNAQSNDVKKKSSSVSQLVNLEGCQK